MKLRKYSLIRIVLVIVNLILLTACVSPSETPHDITPLNVSNVLPGTHLAYGENPPQGYQSLVSVNEVYRLHGNGEDIWFYTRSDDLFELDKGGGLRAWLAATEALQFPVDQALLFWIPATYETDRLAFTEEHNLTDAIDPAQQAKLWKRQGNKLRTEDSFTPAIIAYQRSVTLNQSDPEAFAGLGAAYLGQGKNEAAIFALGKALELAPNHYWAHRLLGNDYLNLQRYALAADELTQAFVLNPQDTHLLLGIALGQGRSGDKDQALRTLEMLFSRTEDPQQRTDAELLRQEFSQDIQ